MLGVSLKSPSRHHFLLVVSLTITASQHRRELGAPGLVSIAGVQTHHDTTHCLKADEHFRDAMADEDQPRPEVDGKPEVGRPEVDRGRSR